MLALALAVLLSALTPAQEQAQKAVLKMEPIMAKAVDVPPPAAMAGISVHLRCSAQSGVVADCRVLDETRPGLGFGDAAVALMNGTSADPAWTNARSADATFDHTIEFTP